uniref:CUB domain-containing protein n=1 Tax=Timema poppense TaxID=170557 RepID=A0A7R9H2Y2_TIMPO|nr:unnamed protein product [Timema poppensis]
MMTDEKPPNVRCTLGGHQDPKRRARSDLSCRNTRQSVGSIYTRTNFVTLKYVTDGWGTESNGFKLVITAFKDKSKFGRTEIQAPFKITIS